MTRAQVEINFEEAKRQARVIEEAVEILRRADREHAEMQDGAAAVWKGRNADHFQSISRELGKKMEKQTKLFAELAEWTRHRAQVLYDAEMEAIRIAEERAYREQQTREAEAARAAEQARAEEASRQQEEQARQVGEQIGRNIRELFDNLRR
ncbi:MAG: hypothetical protein K5879_00325 [Lachnospiraceae bacterium]|nr:hypothetical protein [Lachnospiraceae bacterium]